jgi:hypothetical protein
MTLIEQAPRLIVQVRVQVALLERKAATRSRPQVGRWCEGK